MNWSILAPVQILWINLVTDTFPAIALGVEPAEGDVMKHRPRGNQGSFLAHGVGFNIIYQGILEGLLTLGVYALGILYPVHQGSALIHADALTMAYITLGLIQLLHACNCKSLQGTIFKAGEFKNRYFNWAVLSSAILLAGTIFIPSLNPVFHTIELNAAQWGIVIGAGVLMVLIVEIVKAVQRRQKH